MQPDLHISTIAHAIQLAVAPVFLLTGIGAMLGVMANRLGRIIDRSRVLAAQPEAAEVSAVRGELRALGRRACLIHRAISLCTLCALLICCVIATLFVGGIFNADVSIAIGVLFVAGMLALIGGLVNFLREVYLATASMRIGVD
jgi:hypothetical protein